MKTGLVVDRRYEEHDTGRGHPESPHRIRAIRDMLAQYRRDDLVAIEPRAATREELVSNHGSAYVERVAATADRGVAAFDADTPVSSGSYETARLAVGGVLNLLDAIVAGDVENGFAFVRPPGHHAETDRAMGFCLFNNVAIGVRHLRQRHNLTRILVLDWDVHHGNGTQASFYDDPDTLYVSTHQYPFYPGTGAASEVGVGAGVGRTVNVPLPAGCGDDEYVAAFETLIAPIAAQFRPEVVLLSAGFDAHRRDPLASMVVTDEGFRAMARIMMRVARAHAGGRIAAILEGGYDMEALRSAIPVVIDELAGCDVDVRLPTPHPHAQVLQPVLAAQRGYWDV
jgi:acetoin utilization deacetylase AcuC-like enzyme